MHLYPDGLNPPGPISRGLQVLEIPVVRFICIIGLSVLFSGMFPWMMLATMPLFCHPDWPRGLLHKFPHFLQIILPADLPVQSSQHCIYEKKSVKPDEKLVRKFSYTDNIML